MGSPVIVAAALAALFQSVSGPQVKGPQIGPGAGVQTPSRGCTATRHRSVMFVNDSEKPVKRITLINPNVSGEPRVLEGADLPSAGTSMAVDFDDPDCGSCVYHITVEFEDETTRTEQRFNACSRWEWRVSGKREPPLPRN